jgi:IS30 family transposase
MGKIYEQLSLEERCTIARLREAGQSIRQIAAALDRSASTISRELARNSTHSKQEYRPVHADEQAWARRWRGSKLERHPDLQHAVLDLLAMGWSPEQVASRMALEERTIRVSTETIYRFIYAQYARSKDGRWRLYLPRAKFKRGYRGRRGGALKQGKTRSSIHDRPPEIDRRETFGHWESDLLMFGDKKRNLMVLQERKSRYAFLSLQRRKYARPIAEAQTRFLAALPERIRQTLTLDNGTEFAATQQVEEQTGIQAYYCDTAKPWQKGGVENLNGRLRRYLPRQMDVSRITASEIELLQDIINSTPRKCLGFRTPAEVFNQALHLKCESTSPLSRG